MTSLAKLLSAYSSGEGANKTIKERPPYKHTLHDTLQSIWEGCNSAGQAVDDLQGDINICRDEGGLGLMFIIIDKLPFESIWRIWLEQCSSIHQERVHIWIHAKFPDRVTSPWVRQHLVKSFQLKPEWGSLELTDVMVRMLKEATEEPSSQMVTHLMYLSESCVPIVSLERAFHEMGIRCEGNPAPAIAILSESTEPAPRATSWLNYNLTATNGYAQQGQFDVLRGTIPTQCLVKADQWIMLSRQHAQAVLALPDRIGAPLLPLFKKVRASDEMFFPCCLAILGHIPTTVADKTDSTTQMPRLEVVRRPITWCDWSEKGKNPASYAELTEDAVREAMGRGCLFFRKIKLSGTSSLVPFVQKWARLVYKELAVASEVSCLGDDGISKRVAEVLSEVCDVPFASSHGQDEYGHFQSGSSYHWSDSDRQQRGGNDRWQHDRFNDGRGRGNDSHDHSAKDRRDSYRNTGNGRYRQDQHGRNHRGGGYRDDGYDHRRRNRSRSRDRDDS